MTACSCPVCVGKRLYRVALAVKISGRDIAEVSDLAIKELRSFSKQVHLSEAETVMLVPIV